MNSSHQLTCVITSLILFTVIISGCGQQDEAADKDDQTNSNAPTLATPEDLARYVHACILKNDFEAYLIACVQVEDLKAMLSLVPDGREREHLQGRIDMILRDPAFFEAKYKEAFDKIVLTVHAHGTYDVEFISATPRDDEEVQIDFEMLDSLSTHLTNGQSLHIGLPFKINGRWTTGIDGPVSYGRTTPQDREHQIADGYSAQSLTLLRHPEADKVQEQMVLRDVGIAFMNYTIDNRDCFPRHADETVAYARKGADTFNAAIDVAHNAPLNRDPEKSTEPYTYGSFTFMPLAGLRASQIRRPSEFPIAFSRQARGEIGEQYRVVTYLDGHTSAVSESEFQALLAQSLEELGQYTRTPSE